MHQGLPRTLKAMMTQYTCVGSPPLEDCSSQLLTMRSWYGKSPAPELLLGTQAEMPGHALLYAEPGWLSQSSELHYFEFG